MKDRKVVIIGGGFGGLSCACFLARKGFDVKIIEKNDSVGGRASLLEAEGYRFDMGPSWYLMPDVFERFFDKLGRDRQDYFEIKKLQPGYRIFFKDGDEVDVYSDSQRMAEVFESYEEGAGEQLKKYLDKSRKNYEVAMEDFVLKDRSRLRDFLSLDVLKNARGLTLLGSMQDHVKSYFENPKLQKIMQYSLVFLGGSPSNTPALYNLMSHVDFNQGVYYPEGGMYGVVEALEEIAEEEGVEIYTGEEAVEIRESSGGPVIETSERTLKPDIVVSNADYAYTETELLSDQNTSYDTDYWDKKTMAPSAFLLYLGLSDEFSQLDHHNLVLPEDWNQHFEKIFESPDIPEDPAYYVCNASATDDSVAPEGCSSIFVLVPIAPDLEFNEEEFRDMILEDLESNTGADIRNSIEVEERFSVEDFASRYNSYRGTALGLAHTLRQTAFMRPSRKSKKLEGLYYTGSYTNPGIGVPMCLISGEQTAERIIENEADTG